MCAFYRTRPLQSSDNAEWKFPKHILLCASVHHLYLSKQLTTILQKLGHYELYYFGLELQTAMAKTTDEVSTFLSLAIITGDGKEGLHSGWNSLNKITTNVHGSK